MNFIEAVKAMKEGKKVRRKDWEANKYCTKHDWRDYVLLDSAGATNWEIYEEENNRNLADKYVYSKVHGNCFRDIDIKTFIHKFKEYVKGSSSHGLSKDRICEIIDKLSGKL